MATDIGPVSQPVTSPSVQAALDARYTQKTTTTTLQNQVNGLNAASVGAAPYALASGATGIRFIGSGTTLPSTAAVGDVFLLTS